MSSTVVRSLIRASIIFVCAVLLLALSPAGSVEAKWSSASRSKSANSNKNESMDINEAPVFPWLETLLTTQPTSKKLHGGPTQLDATTKMNKPEMKVSALPSNSVSIENEIVDPSFPKPRDLTALYTSPSLEGEGVWTAKDLPRTLDGHPLIYKTVYRPSVEFPNSVVYLAIFNMKRLKVRFFVGNTEPGVQFIANDWPREDLTKIVALTNALWMQQHARGAGAIFRGKVIYPMVDGMATLVIYKDDSVDILEWSKDVPRYLVKDARQLRHLIVKNGLVVEQIAKDGKLQEAEIGLGGFLVDKKGRSTMHNKLWFLANRTAFGIRDDGNLVFAMGHHISTKDLAKALVLAGCKRAIHGDANIHNIVCNFFFRDERDRIVKRDKLSPEQLKYTMKRYDHGYSKDFFAFYEK
jgi:hypothetical protein